MVNRLAYLKALEIDVWERRGGPSEAANAAAVDPLASMERPDTAPMARALESHEPAPLELQSDSEIAVMDWAALEGAVRNCTRCPLHSTRTQGVFGVGDRNARWMVIGEAPGADEDRQGEPFVGRAGQLLNAMLRGIGLKREQIFIANILKSRPPSNRDPRPEEARACIPYLFRQIELINPTLILCVGRIAAQTLLQTDTPIGKLRGKLHRIAAAKPSQDWPMVVTYHPAYLLRSPAEKRRSWDDLLFAVRTFESLSVGA
jgi:uracil-DNA glycosylase